MAARPTIASTLAWAAELHAGQTDQAGEPYVLHPMRVSANIRKIFPAASDEIIMAALLHDTFEDCGVTPDDMRRRGYSEECIAMVQLVSKPEDDMRPYDVVIADLIASGNQGAMLIKIGDNMDNLHPERVAALQVAKPEKAQRLGDRYRDSIRRLCAAAGLDIDQVLETVRKAPPLQQAACVPGLG